MNNQLTIDIGSSSVDLCKWDGRSVHVEKLRDPDSLDLSGLIERMSPRPGFDLIVRSTRADYVLPDTRRGDAEEARVYGARSFRTVPADCAADPGESAARQAADRQRLGCICSVEIGAAIARVALIDSQGRRISNRSETIPHGATTRGSDDRAVPDFVIPVVRRFLDSTGAHNDACGTGAVSMVCYGGAGPALATKLAEACGIQAILIPVFAGTLACVGMLFADIVLTVREQVEPRPFEFAYLRRQFGRLMDSAAAAVTRHGYDIDDTECMRIVELGIPGGAESIEIEVDSLAVSDAVLRRFVNSIPGAGGHVPEIRAFSVHATIATPKPTWPLPAAPASSSAAHSARDVCFSPTVDPVVERAAMATGAALAGPATVTERHTSTVIGSGWTAEVLGTGDMLLRSKT